MCKQFEKHMFRHDGSAIEVHVHKHLSQDNVHAHSLPKYQLHSSTHMQKCQGHGLDTIEALG